jgi:hypothetical protein
VGEEERRSAEGEEVHVVAAAAPGVEDDVVEVV